MEKEKIKTSIIIPVYNAEQYLAMCIESVLAQTQKEIEIILVDDGSTDGSFQIINNYKKKYPFIKSIHQENQKQGAARNAGVNMASGEYIYFLDSDDYIREDLCEVCYQIAESEKLDFVMFDATVSVEGELSDLRAGSEKEEYDRSNIGIEDRIYSGIEYWNKMYQVKGIHANVYLVYINAAFLKKNQLQFETGIFYEDMDWIVRLYLCAQRIRYVSQKFYLRRIHQGSVMTVSYNNIHMGSSALLFGKLTQMLKDEQEPLKRNIILPIWESMLWRFKEISDFYYMKNQLRDVKKEILKFYHDLPLAYEGLGIECNLLRLRLLLMAEELKRKMGEAGVSVDASEFDLENYKWRLVSEEMENIPLDDKHKIIGIYGIGILCSKFLALYQKKIGDIKAEIFFIDTYCDSSGKYMGRRLYNVKDIGGMKVDAVLIASARYREEMMKNVQLYCVSKTEILFVPQFINKLYQGDD